MCFKYLTFDIYKAYVVLSVHIAASLRPSCFRYSAIFRESGNIWQWWNVHCENSYPPVFW